MPGTFLIPLFLCVVGVAARTGYELLKKAGRIDTRNIVVLAAMMLAMTAFLGSWLFMGTDDPTRAYSSKAARWLGLCIAFAGACLVIGGILRLKKVENLDHLVTTGLFARMRHPMYTGFIAWMCGWVICHGSVLSAVVAAIGIGNVLYWRHLEDTALESRYGDEYRRYRERTPF